ncbi:unnamed protein product [Ceratitis capitata]|uniref:(Mediterranean fruit fly) hypothetical protein n=1 Tax=Ceratitis capitata TaxID=7213 RepID=A0A811V6V1_CERCA|nr:unnamed protein product [Ceratitis capitata]
MYDCIDALIRVCIVYYRRYIAPLPLNNVAKPTNSNKTTERFKSNQPEIFCTPYVAGVAVILWLHALQRRLSADAPALVSITNVQVIYVSPICGGIHCILNGFNTCSVTNRGSRVLSAQRNHLWTILKKDVHLVEVSIADMQSLTNNNFLWTLAASRSFCENFWKRLKGKTR